jgi:hypothetical protein
MISAPTQTPDLTGGGRTASADEFTSHSPCAAVRITHSGQINHDTAQSAAGGPIRQVKGLSWQDLRQLPLVAPVTGPAQRPKTQPTVARMAAANHDKLKRPLPRHRGHGGGKILRPGSAGWATLGNPVPSQAEHLTSVGTGFDFIGFMMIVSWI